VGINGFYSLEHEMNETKGKNGTKIRWDDFHNDPTVLEGRIVSAERTKNISSDHINEYYSDFLISLINKSKQKGIHLIFVLPPRLSKNAYSELIPIANSLPQQNIPRDV